MGLLGTIWTLRNVFVIILTPLMLTPLLMQGTPQSSTGFCLILMAVYWLTEAFPIPVTALLPVMLFPVLGIMTGKQTSASYIHDASMLFVGGVIMAAAVEYWNIHKRIALKLLLVIGTKPARLMLGMMLPSWVLSMWTSNIATTAMLCPIADALLKELEYGGGDESTLDQTHRAQNDGVHTEANYKEPEESSLDTELVADSNNHNSNGIADRSADDGIPSKEHRQLAKAMTMSIAYSANIGGTATITGCASNIILKGMADDLFRERGLSSGISFGTWLVLGFPVSCLIFIVLFLWLTFYFRGCTFPEVTVILLFLVLILLWMSRDLGGAGGWGNLFKPTYVTDSAAPTLVLVLLFLIPANLPDFFKTTRRPRCVRPLLTWKVVHEKVPWGLFLLVGGGFALAKACKVSGLSETIQETLTVFQDLPAWLTCLIVASVTSFITEVTTNTATCTLILPIIAQLALRIGVNPLYLMIPTAVSTSYAFMLPVATPPNAMVYILGYFSISEMMRAGFILNIVSVLILTVGVNTWGSEYFSLHTLPPEFLDHSKNLSTFTTVMTTSVI